MIDLEKMAKEHEKLFPKATLESQVWKLEEEIAEYQEAKGFEESLKEMADIVIVCGGLYRWCPLLAETIYCERAQYTLYYWEDELEEEVKRKWQINLKRKWKWNGKTYHHIKTGDDE